MSLIGGPLVCTDAAHCINHLLSLSNALPVHSARFLLSQRTPAAFAEATSPIGRGTRWTNAKAGPQVSRVRVTLPKIPRPNTD